VRGTPSASVGRARGPRDAPGYAVHGRVTPGHMTTVPSSLPFSSGIKVTTRSKPRPPTRRSGDQFNPLIVVRHRHMLEDIPKPSELCRVSGRNGGQFNEGPCSDR